MINNDFSVGIYLRLSREDAKGISESIQNQKDFLMEYLRKNNWNLIQIYIDDGWSGTNFERPAFKNMLADIENNKINCVITKDLSRLGRDYITTGYYLEKYFPMKKVRFIAVNDGIDTYTENSGNDMSPFRSVMNDMYAKDISKKVRTALHTKKLKGEFIGSVAPYGYTKSPNNKNKLVIDPQTAIIVERIFSMFISGWSKLGIANQLTSEGIPTPSKSKNLTATQKRHPGVWNQPTITRILTNPTYIGNLTQNRTRKINYKVDTKINLSHEDWIVVKNTHQPIISQENFALAQQLMSARDYVKQNEKTHLLSGLIKCGDCNGSMTFASKYGNIVCSTWKKYTKLGLCTSHSMKEKEVEAEVMSILKQLTKNIDKNKLLDAIKANSSISVLESDLEKFMSFDNITRQTLVMLLGKIEIFNNKRMRIYFNFCDPKNPK